MLAGAKRDVITSWLTVLSRRWEQQPDSDEIHMSFPNKLVSACMKIYSVP